MMSSQNPNAETTAAIMRGVGRALRRVFEPATALELPEQHRRLVVELERREQGATGAFDAK